VAVLPLQNLSGDAEQEYFADGMTEALITDLAKIGALKVISRSSAMRYKGAKKPLAQIAKELGVDAVVEGSAQRVGDRVRIMAQLVDPQTERALWGESYDRAVTDVLRLQGEVAQAIARKIGAAVTPEEQARLSARRTVAPEALAAYLRGVFHQQRFTPQDLETALEQFSRALEIDPDYAAALVGTARVWATRTAAGLTSPRDAAPHWSEALRKALELDPDLPEAHMALAHAKSAYDWDWEAAEAEFKRSLELNPSLAEARVFYSQRLDHLGRFAEGTEQMDLALELDPLNPLYQVLSGIHLIWVGRVDEAVDRLRTTFAKTPGFGLGHIPLWTALDLKGKHGEALEELKAHYALAQGDALTVKAIESGYAEGGYTSALRRAAEVLEERARSRHVGALNLASLYDRAGDTAKAVEWLERAYEERDPSLPAVGVIPFSERLRGDARFQEMLRRLKLPDLGPWTSRAR
jgi:TolB-like protein/lipoprotein NlpI